MHMPRFHCRQLDNRLTKVPPVKAAITLPVVKEPGDMDESTLKRMVVNNVSAGKAYAYTKSMLKAYKEFQVKVSSLNIVPEE